MARRRPAILLALVFALTLAACAEGTGSGGQLEGTRWVLDSYGDDGELTIVDEGLYADADFNSARVTGFSGCNTFSALYRAGGRTLLVSNPSVTFMACDEETMAFEQAYLGLLNQSRFYTVRRDTLTIFDGDRNTILRFDAAPRNPLLGAWTVESFETAPGTVSAVQEGTELDMAFRIGTLGGFAGCNSFTGVYGTNGSIVRVGKLALTRLACDEEVMDQETAFVAALEGAAVIESRGSQVNLTDRNGNLKVALVRPSPETATPAPEPTEEPSSEPTPTPKPTAKPTPTPTAKPTATPTAKPTPEPTPAPTASPAPTRPPASIPPTATCELVRTDGIKVASVVYPGDWSVTSGAPSVACRYFDPEPITLPTDGSVPDVAVYAVPLADSYEAAVTAATDPAVWTVSASAETEVDGVAMTCIDAVATSGAQGVAEGEARYVCLADVGSSGTVAIGSIGTPGDEVFVANAAVASLMALATTYVPGS